MMGGFTMLRCSKCKKEYMYPRHGHRTTCCRCLGHKPCGEGWKEEVPRGRR